MNTIWAVHQAYYIVGAIGERGRLGSSQDEQVQIVSLYYPTQKHKTRQVFQDVAALEESANITSQ